MKKLLILLAALGGILLFSGCESKGWKTVDGVIVFDTPAREPGQKSVLGLKTAPMETVRVGFIGCRTLRDRGWLFGIRNQHHRKHPA